MRHIVSAAFGKDVRDANWVVCGDLNDYAEVDGSSRMPDLVSGEWQPTAMAELVGGAAPFGVDACSRIADPLDDGRATTRRTTSTRSSTTSSCRRVLPSGTATPSRYHPEGLPYRAARYEGMRYPRIGWDRPKASDHCPLAVTLELG